MLNVTVGMYNGYKSLYLVQSIEIGNDKSNDVIPAQELIFETEPGCWCISVFSFQFIQKTFSGNLIMNSKQFNPAAVFRAVLADGVVEKG